MSIEVDIFSDAIKDTLNKRQPSATKHSGGCKRGIWELDGKKLLMDKLSYRLDHISVQLPFKHIVANGVWLVPIEERPKGWEKMGVKEQ